MFARFLKGYLFVSILAIGWCLLRPCCAEPPPGKDWKLVWRDEFDGKQLDESKWEKVGDGPRRKAFWLLENAYLDGNGHLVVRSKKDGERYSCGGIRTRGKYERRFGYFEIRCKVPDEVGTWAAFWLMTPAMRQVGDEGRDGSEIDIFESPWREKDVINIAIHWDGYGRNHKSAAWKIETPGVNEGFHTFALGWTPDEYVFYCDDKEIKRTDAGGVCQVPVYLKVTTEIGEWAGDISKATLPDYFVVDYVRVYETTD